MNKTKETQQIPSEFNLKSYIEEWYLLQIYGRLVSFSGKGNKYNDLVKKRLKQGGLILGIILLVNIIFSLLPVFSIVLNNIIRLSLLAGLPIIGIWVYLAQKKDKLDEAHIYDLPLPEEKEIELYQILDDAMYVNYYNRYGYWYYLNWEDIVYAEIVPTQLFLGNKANRMISKERNKLLIGELNERFNFANSQVNQLPYERKIVQEGMVSLQFVTQNGINLLPIPPSWITEGFVEDLLIFIDSKINERFYIKPEDVNTLKMNFPKFFEYVNSTIIKREKIVKDFEEDLGYSTEDIKDLVKQSFVNFKNKIKNKKKDTKGDD